MTENTKAMLMRIQKSNLRASDKTYLCKLVRRDTPEGPGFYYGETQFGHKRLTKCPSCGKSLRPVTEKRPEEENRFCTGCGQRIRWNGITPDNQ